MEQRDVTLDLCSREEENEERKERRRGRVKKVSNVGAQRRLLDDAGNFWTAHWATWHLPLSACGSSKMPRRRNSRVQLWLVHDGSRGFW